MKYWSKIHFNHDAHFYYSKSYSLSPDDVILKEEMQSWFQGLGYVQWFHPSEVPHTEEKKRRIDTHAILSAINHEEKHFR